MFVRQIKKPNIKEFLGNLPSVPQLPCHNCGKLMNAKPRLLGDINFDPKREGWEFIIIADNYKCKRFHNCNPNEWFSGYRGDDGWKWCQPARGADY